MLGYIEDFLLAEVYPNAFDFRAMPLRWQAAQRELAGLKAHEDGFMTNLRILELTQGKGF